jgi:hypothetical protein
MKMSQNVRHKAAYQKKGNKGYTFDAANGGYVYGSAVRRLEPAVKPYEEVPAQKNPIVRKNREKARHMSLGYVVFLAAAMCAAAFILLNYIELQAELTQKTKSVAAKEIQLNNLKVSNDEAYNRALNSVTLEDIKRIAIGELGMTYAGEGQIVVYSNESSDYMRRVDDN